MRYKLRILNWNLLYALIYFKIVLFIIGYKTNRRRAIRQVADGSEEFITISHFHTSTLRLPISRGKLIPTIESVNLFTALLFA
jgi:hypothetical protein